MLPGASALKTLRRFRPCLQRTRWTIRTDGVRRVRRWADSVRGGNFSFFFFFFDISIGIISIDKHANDPPLLLCNYRRCRYGLNLRSCAFRSTSFVRGGRFVCPIGFSDGVWRSCVPETADVSLHATEILIDFFSFNRGHR